MKIKNYQGYLQLFNEPNKTAEEFAQVLLAAKEVHDFHPFTKITLSMSLLDKALSYDPHQSESLRKIVSSWYEQYPDIVFNKGVSRWLILENPEIIKDLKDCFGFEGKDIAENLSTVDVGVLPKDFFYNIMKVYDAPDSPQEKLTMKELNDLVSLNDITYLKMRLDMFPKENLERGMAGLKDAFLKCFTLDKSITALPSDRDKKREIAQVVYDKYYDFLSKNSSKLLDIKESRMEIIIRGLFLTADPRQDPFVEIDLLSLNMFTKKNFTDFKYPTYKVYLESNYVDAVHPIIRGNGMRFFDELGIAKLEKGKILNIYEEVGLPTFLLAYQKFDPYAALLNEFIKENPMKVCEDFLSTKEKIEKAGFIFTLKPDLNTVFTRVVLEGAIPVKEQARKTLKV